MSMNDLTAKFQQHVDSLRGGTWRDYAREGVYAFVGLFWLDVAWRFMDWILDSLIIPHIHILHFLLDP